MTAEFPSPDHRLPAGPFRQPRLYAARSASTNSATPSITMVGGVRPDPSGRAKDPSRAGSRYEGLGRRFWHAGHRERESGSGIRRRASQTFDTAPLPTVSDRARTTRTPAATELRGIRDRQLARADEGGGPQDGSAG
jgi:hypothetical protein